MNNAAAFDGSFEFLPIRSALDTAPVPTHPTDDDFHLAVSALRSVETADGSITWHIAAARWRVEAIRARRSAPGCDIASPAVFAATAAALYEYTRAS